MKHSGFVKALTLSTCIFSFGQTAAAQEAEVAIDCTLEENANEAICVAANDLPPGDVQDFLFVAPILGGAALLAAAAGGGGGSTPSTPSTN